MVYLPGAGLPSFSSKRGHEMGVVVVVFLSVVSISMILSSTFFKATYNVPHNHSLGAGDQQGRPQLVAGASLGCPAIWAGRPRTIPWTAGVEDGLCGHRESQARSSRCCFMFVFDLSLDCRFIAAIYHCQWSLLDTAVFILWVPYHYSLLPVNCVIISKMKLLQTVVGGSDFLYVTMSGLAHIHTWWRTPYPTCIDLEDLQHS